MVLRHLSASRSPKLATSSVPGWLTSAIPVSSSAGTATIFAVPGGTSVYLAPPLFVSQDDAKSWRFPQLGITNGAYAGAGFAFAENDVFVINNGIIHYGN